METESLDDAHAHHCRAYRQTVWNRRVASESPRGKPKRLRPSVGKCRRASPTCASFRSRHHRACERRCAFQCGDGVLHGPGGQRARRDSYSETSRSGALSERALLSGLPLHGSGEWRRRASSGGGRFHGWHIAGGNGTRTSRGRDAAAMRAHGNSSSEMSRDPTHLCGARSSRPHSRPHPGAAPRGSGSSPPSGLASLPCPETSMEFGEPAGPPPSGRYLCMGHRSGCAWVRRATSCASTHKDSRRWWR